MKSLDTIGSLGCVRYNGCCTFHLHHSRSITKARWEKIVVVWVRLHLSRFLLCVCEKSLQQLKAIKLQKGLLQGSFHLSLSQGGESGEVYQTNASINLMFHTSSRIAPNFHGNSILPQIFSMVCTFYLAENSVSSKSYAPREPPGEVTRCNLA